MSTPSEPAASAPAAPAASSSTASEPVFFASAHEFGEWLREHHEDHRELVVEFWKVHTGRVNLSWSDAVDEALCVGWIDGVGRRLDHDRCSIRFTPRRPGSIWSRVNIAKVEALTAAGRMLPAGLAAFAARTEARSGVYAFEQDPSTVEPTPEIEAALAAAGAWEFFLAQPTSYRQPAIWWVVSAKRPETRTRRLATLVEDSAAGRRLRHLSRP